MLLRSTGIVIPSYNEKASIAQLVSEVLKHVPDAKVVVVDDSPNEETAFALKPLLGPQVSLVRRAKKGGRGSAVIEGMRVLLTQGIAQVVEMDADFSHPPAQLPELIAQSSRENCDLLIASRYLERSQIKNWPASRRIFSFLSNRLARVVLAVPIVDYTNGFRCYSRRAAELIVSDCGRLGTGFIALSEILVHLHYRGFKIAETPTVFVNRLRGESSLNFVEIKNALRGLIRIHGLKRQLMRGQR